MNFTMNKIIIVYLLLVIRLAFAQSDSALVIFKTNNDSTGFFVDNKFLGIGKNIDLKIEEGIHTIFLTENIRQWDAEIIKDTISIEDSDELVLEYNFKERNLVNTIPQDVYIYDQDSLIGFTPTYIETGLLSLQLEKPDYKTISVDYNEISNGKTPELQFTGEPPKTSFYGSTLFTVLLGTAIALGATTAYLKLEADDNFEEYLITGDPELIDKVDQYDLASGTSLVLMELNVALIIYLFLSE